MKTYKLTQEQINQLAEVPNTQYLLQEFIPEAFETKLEVGKWYIHKEHKDLINIAEINKKDEIKFYGFDYDESENTSRFVDERNSPLFYGYGKNFSNLRLATEEEVREALINEAKKRYTNKKARCLDTNDIIKINFNELTYYEDINGLYAFDDDLDTEIEIFKDGIWAEIIEEKKYF